MFRKTFYSTSSEGNKTSREQTSTEDRREMRIISTKKSDEERDRSDTTLLSADIKYVVSADEGVPVLVLQLSVHVLLRLLQGDVHVSVETSENPWNGINRNS